MRKHLASIFVVSLFLFLGYSISRAGGQVGKLNNGVVEGPPYYIMYSTGPNQSGIIYYIDNQGNEAMAGNIANYGSITSSGTVTSVGSTNTGTAVVTGQTVYTPFQFGGGQTATFGVLGSSVIPYSATNMMILASATLTMNALPAISTNVIAGLSNVGGTGGVISDGSFVVLTTTATGIKIKFQDNSGLSGTLLDLTGGPNNATSEVLTSTRPITLQFNAGTGHWVQISPNNGTF